MPDYPSEVVESTRARKPLLIRSLPLERETSFFILASALDALLTYVLLQGEHFVEANPVARFFLYHWGIQGMVYFKFAMVAFVCVIAQVIAARRHETARRLLYAATLIVASVVVYSMYLFASHAEHVIAAFGTAVGR